MSEQLKCAVRRTEGGVHLVLAKAGLVNAVALDNESALILAEGLTRAVVANEMEHKMAERSGFDSFNEMIGDDESDDGDDN